MSKNKVEKIYTYFKYVTDLLESQVTNEDSMHRLMEVALNYGNGVDNKAYEYFEIKKEECDRTKSEYPGTALFQTMMIDDDFENPMSKDDIKLFKKFKSYCTEHADPVLYSNLDSDSCYNKINTYFINEFLKERS